MWCFSPSSSDGWSSRRFRATPPWSRTSAWPGSSPLWLSATATPRRASRASSWWVLKCAQVINNHTQIYKRCVSFNVSAARLESHNRPGHRARRHQSANWKLHSELTLSSHTICVVYPSAIEAWKMTRYAKILPAVNRKIMLTQSRKAGQLSMKTSGLHHKWKII